VYSCAFIACLSVLYEIKVLGILIGVKMSDNFGTLY
jgi:hypothetical protein